ncbi:MAG: hypothetical protein AAF654_06305 [Myxococcota bacterium]
MTRDWLMLVALCFVIACTDDSSSSSFGDRAEGESCDEISDCQAGFDCSNDVCVAIAPLGARGFGADCTSDGDCAEGLLCGRQGPDGEPRGRGDTRVCTDLPLLPEGSTCALTVQCDFDLLCSGGGQCVPEGSPNTEPEGATCAEFDSCRRPFVCGPDDTCVEIPIFLGLDCTASSREAGLFRSYFEVPPSGLESSIEFYRLPYPNDIRVRDGRIDLGGHPSPGDVLGASVDDLYFGPIEADSRGFAVNQPVFFRFSESLDPATLCIDTPGVYGSDGLCADSGTPSVFLVNIDRDSADYNQRFPLEMVYDPNAGAYICQNWVGVAPLPGEPLRNLETYAVVVTSDIRSVAGGVPIQDQDLSAVLGAVEPDDSELAAAHAAMAPFREWMTDTGVDPASIANVAVYTTEDATRLGPALRAAASSLPVEFGDAVECDGTVAGPCAIAGTDRGCPTQVSADWFEIQGTYAGPVIQSGTRPYLRLSDGGAITLNDDGDIQLEASNETMCFGLAVPRNGSPSLFASTYPVVIYGHGTDGDYRSAFADGTVELLTGLGFAVLTFDNVMHGPRQGTNDPNLWQDPGQLFFNPLNPPASRDNVLQGAADLFRLTQLAQDASVNVGQVTLSFSQIYYYGHSQGTVISPAYLAYETGLTGVFQSGAGAELALSILNKKEPQGLDQVVGASFGDPNLQRIHPMLGLLAQLFGPADATAYAPLIVSGRPGPERFPYLQIQGIDDNFSPDVTQHALLRAMEIPFVGMVTQSVTGVNEVSSPLVAEPVAGAIQLAPVSGEDGHFVAFRDPAARAAIGRFFESVLVDAAEIIR